MRRFVQLTLRCSSGCVLLAVCVLAGCAGRAGTNVSTDELTIRDRIEHYQAARSEQLAEQARYPSQLPAYPDVLELPATALPNLPTPALTLAGDASGRSFNLGTLAFSQEAAAGSQPAATQPTAHPVVPEGYWRADVWHQMGHEALDLGRHDFWKGFKTSYWNLPNALVLTATLGGSYAIRETGVDDTVADRVHHHRKLGQYDDSIQILGHPGLHFAGAGVLWLGSALAKDMKEHEVAKSLIQALAVNGVSTEILKLSTNTSSPDGDRYGWPSGHTSSAFTAAAVLNEYYGPWVGVPSFALAGLVGYQRIDSRVHDFSDVVFGAMMGYIIGTAIARDNQAAFPELFGMKVIPYVNPETGTTGIALTKEW